MNGRGVYTSMDSARFDGHWKDDLKSGWGSETRPDGCRLEGEFLNG